MPFAKTMTGEFLIGFRSGDRGWQENLDEVLSWTVVQSFGTIDLPASRIDRIGSLTEKGLKVGSVDLMSGSGFQDLLSPDKAKRGAAVGVARQNIEKSAKAGATIFFTVMLPEDPGRPRAENFGYLVESYASLTPTLEACGAKIVIEGWPGAGALCCTPETYRALFAQVPSPALGVNYDPSHLIRMGIDHVRFLHEFASRVYHVHAKDTEINADHLYEFGSEQPATFAPSTPYGAWAWRYTIPGHGITRWSEVFKILAAAGYRGFVSIELEDARFNGDAASKQLGLIKSREFLEGC
jgi:sugar phosphate isomerase/epimerase